MQPVDRVVEPVPGRGKVGLSETCVEIGLKEYGERPARRNEIGEAEKLAIDRSCVPDV
jgi:hypothetical protein